MKSISELKFNKESLSKSERTQIIKEIYSIYTSISEKKHRRDENIKRYKSWLKSNSLKHSKDIYVIFTRTGKFIREIKPSSFAYFVSHVKTKDLYFVKSICFDKSNRNESIGKYIIGLQYTNEKR